MLTFSIVLCVVSCKLCFGFGQGGPIAGSACMIYNVTNSLFLCYLVFFFCFVRIPVSLKLQPEKQSGCGILSRKET